jgi:hypothetical protein
LPDGQERWRNTGLVLRALIAFAVLVVLPLLQRIDRSDWKPQNSASALLRGVPNPFPPGMIYNFSGFSGLGRLNLDGDGKSLTGIFLTAWDINDRQTGAA